MPQNKQRRATNLNDGTPILGMPGYRTRGNRSGLDPLDTRAEAAYMEGTFYRRLFTLKIRTRNPFYLTLMFLFGVIPFIGITFLVLSTLVSGGLPNNGASIFPVLVFLVICGFLALNFLLSVAQVTGLIPAPHSLRPIQKIAKEKKLPKRRKDFK
jgi:hypothetical protein